MKRRKIRKIIKNQCQKYEKKLKNWKNKIKKIDWKNKIKRKN